MSGDDDVGGAWAGWEEAMSALEKAEAAGDDDELARANEAVDRALVTFDAAVHAASVTQAQSDAVDRAIAAWDEGGPVVVEVWCGQCKDGADAVGHVRRFSGGYVFRGIDPTDADVIREKYLTSEFRRRGHERVPFVRQGAIFVVLTAPQVPSTDWPPRAVCPDHGPTGGIDPNALLKAARSAKPGQPNKLSTSPHA